MSLEIQLKEARERLRNNSYNEFDLLLEQPLLKELHNEYQKILLKISQEKMDAINKIDSKYRQELETALKHYIFALNMAVSSNDDIQTK